MGFRDLFAGSAISGTGMSAERFRMEVIANNIANAQSTRSANGGPYRRQDVVFAELVAGSQPGPKGAGALPVLKGVEVVERVEDPSELPRIYMPGHPDADAEGYVQFPNVQLPIEMVNLLTAARAYEANLKAAQTFRTMNEQALTLLRG
jgi:flagellar basal-body rod protein FlgC